MQYTKENVAKLWDETISYYGADPKGRRCSIDVDGPCRYSGTTVNKSFTSEGCAIGRLMDPINALKLDELIAGQGDQGGGIAFVHPNPAARPLFPEWILAWPVDVLGHLQILHDSPGNWSRDGGLTRTGVDSVAYIVELLDLDESLMPYYLKQKKQTRYS